MPARSQYGGSAALFDIDENQDITHTQPMRRSHESIRHVSIQGATTTDVPLFAITHDDPVLGGSIDFQAENTTTYTRQRHTRKRTRSRRHSAAAAWAICGLTLPIMALRVLTSLVVIPLVIAGLIWVPHVAVVWLCVLLVCVCAYEFSWLAFRIHYQLLSTYTWYERAPSDEDTQVADETEQYPFQSFASGFSNVSSSLMSTSFGPYGNPTYSQTDEDDGEEDHTIGGEGGMAARATKLVASPLDTLEFALAATAVSQLAESWCGGREWLAKLMLTTIITALWIVMMHFLLQSIHFPVALGDLPGAVLFDLPQLAWISVFMAVFLALSTPNFRFAVSMLIQVNAFFAIVTNSLACPMFSMHECTLPLLSVTELFALGAVMLIALRALTSSGPADMVIVTMVDLLGYVFVIGGFTLIAGAVDVHHDHDKMFARVLLLLVVVLWTAQLAGYACNRLISHLQLSRKRLLPRRIAVRVDLEPSVSAICVGVLATALGGSLVALPTPLYINVVFAFFAVLFARLGALFMSLLRRAAGVKRCSRVLPGFGGMLDMTSAILFAAIAFTKLYTIVMLQTMRTRVAPLEDAPAQALSIDFGRLD